MSVYLSAIIAFVALAAGSIILPDWAMFLFAMALAKGLVCLGIIGMMRGGVVSFGQGLYYCIGAYTATLIANHLGVSDIFLLTLLSAAVCLVVGLVFGPLLSNYRGIFFAMLSLALSMVLYGSLSKMSFIGGTDGLNIGAPTFLGWAPEGRPLQTALYLYVVAIVVISGTLMRIYFDSERGLITLATRDNELRVEYLGASVRNLMTYNYVFGALLGGIGGTIAVLALGHVDPEFAFWTTSGEFVFVAILAGYLSVPAVFVAAIILELVRSFSNLYFPNTWQLALGIFLLVVIVALPNGLGSLVSKRKENKT
ncbi:branched-chain amino acid ABC transporter permease [Sulfitobacter noctilucae]|uniref:branched-chain amino acid ABC transporter permease n=1 Tax=Sulfitobacter noctilucae TaxID=1342302 RepID=UPI0019D3641A|nr:branched-chain amino acid ABC transporter permease [Sulfitobacter noctilucae]